MNFEQLADSIITQATDMGPRIGVALVILFAFYIAARICKHLILHAAKRIHLDMHISMLLARTCHITIIIVGLITSLGTLGIDISALVAGLGLTGFAIGFALKDTITNLLSGIMILLYRPFVVGNYIKVSGHEGKVIAIDLRYTELEFETHRILIPNSKLFTDPLVVINKSSTELTG